MIKNIKFFGYLGIALSALWINTALGEIRMSVTEAFYHYAKTQDLSALQKIQQMGYSIDTSDNEGNSALCKAIIEKDYSAFSVLKQLGANTNHECIHKIPPKKIAEFNQGYLGTSTSQNFIQQPQTNKTLTTAKTGTLTATTKVGIGLGVAAVVGGGLALGGGGGGGGSKTTQSNPQDIPTPPPPIIPNCGKNATYNGTICECDLGYEDFVDGQGCQIKDCSGYVESCSEGFSVIPNNTCQSGGKILVKCEPKSCEGFPITYCPQEAVSCSSCQSGNNKKFKINSCKENYILNADKTSCVLFCNTNYYADGNVCMPCPANSTSPAGSHALSRCQCLSGYKMQDGECIAIQNTDPEPSIPSTQNESEKGNFLNKINAASAYAKGYTGFIAENSSDSSTPATFTTNKIKIGVWDSSFDVNHPDLISNIATREFLDGSTKTYGFNTAIGPCKAGDTTNCYGIENGKETGNLVWYDEEGKQTILTKNDITLQTIHNALGNRYSTEYDWDDESIKYNVTPSSTKVNSQTNTGNDHGTHVTGIIGASKNNEGMHGVVPNSELYLATWTNDNYQHIDQYYAAKFFADAGVRVINASFGTPLLDGSGNKQIKTASEFLSLNSKENLLAIGEKFAYQTFAQNNIVIVKAAGNDGRGGQYESSYESSIPMIESFQGGSNNLKNLFISAIAVDKNNKLASYSQYCGANAAWCMAAPGGDFTGDYYLLEQELNQKYKNNEITQDTYLERKNTLQQEWGIYSTVTNDNAHNYIKEDGVSYGYMAGTSMATPVITGSVGLLMSAYPHLSSQNVVEILFRTANKNLDGWGSAFNRGYYNSKTNTYIETIVSDSLSTWTDSFGNSYDISKIYGHGMVDLDAATQPLGTLQTPISDSTQSKTSLINTKLALPRFINTNLSNNLSKTILALDDYNRPFQTPLFDKIKFAQRNTNSFKRTFQSFISPVKIQKAGISDKLSFAFSSAKTDKNPLGLGIFDMNYQFNENTSFKFSYRSDVFNEKEIYDKPLANPFTNMTNSYAFSQQLKWKDLAFSFGTMIGKNAFYETDEDDDDDFNRSVHAFDGFVSYTPNKSLVFKVVGGMMQEKDALLGINGTGVFETNDGTTYYTGASIEYKPVIPFTLSASYYYGRTQNQHSDGLVKFTDLVSDSFALDARYHPDENNIIGLQFSSPLRIRTGSAVFNIPVARDLYEDIVYFDKQKVSLKPQAREYDLGFYHIQQGENYDWRSAFTVRFNPDHMKNAKPDYRAILGLSYKY